ncbi:MAG TPA: sulfite exporter TauE/SafE family protein [Coriobacteriia bacterium]|nr:sulfite exporter TauE/SafE family protein [Coriobacteriia bacterium]
MTAWLPAALVGVGAGILSGAFGVGGGVLTTPAIRLLLGQPELIAVGTPLPAILPTAIAGAAAHARSGTADVRTGLVTGALGVPAAVVGALLTPVVGGTAVLIVTAVVIVAVAIDMLRGNGSGRRERIAAPPPRPRLPVLGALGVATGLYSGFLGLGGGFVLVPLLNRALGMSIKRSIGTSLVAVAVLAVPGSLTHWTLGHVDAGLAFVLAVGAVPGALLGARLNAWATERTIRVAFAVMLACVGALLAAHETGIV